MGATIVDFLRLVWMQLKMNCKNIGTLIMLIVVPIATTIAIVYFLPGGNDNTGKTPLVFINHDQGDLGEAMLATLDTAEIILENDIDDALTKLENNEAIALYILQENFSDLLQAGTIPVIESYQLEIDVVSLFENQMMTFMQQQAKRGLFQQQGIDFTEMEDMRLIDVEISRYEERETVAELMPVLMSIYYMFLTSGTIAGKLFQLKSNNVLKRIITTNTSNFKIITSFCASYFLLQTIATFVVFMIFDFVFGFDVGDPLPLLVTIALMSMISIGISIVIVRLCKNEAMVVQVSQLVGIVLFFAGMVSLFKEVFQLPTVVLILAQLSPFYWANEALLFGNIFPGIVILALIMLVILTAGSLKLEKFIQD